MSTVGSTNSSTSKTNQSASNRYDSLDTAAFLKMMVSELQNQDPMQPMDSSQIVNQMASIRAIQSNDKLSNTLDSVLLGQNLYTGSGLIGKTVSGLNSNNERVTGTVDRVEVADGAATLYIGDNAVSMKNITKIEGASSSES
jgi:flagellar hook assembly protein FlgD